MKKAFSLIELMIVIVIIGVVYTLSINKFQKIGEEPANISLKGLKEYLQKFPHSNNVKLLCLDDCSSCDVFADNEKQASLNDFLDKSVKIYRYDFSYGILKQKKEVYFNKDNVEKDLCFSYTVDKKGVGEQVFVEFKGLVYDFSNYLAPVSVYTSLQEAIDAKEKLTQEVLR
ncbi:prepilin-type N-terminal cleavage/methylation domain-containing protein [Sulfurimonas sp. CS5]|uniref:prepilin-type N-terminal cleavage/methylation domain-containing protein n=1 Tax=Sulfurimonas sp. CS5 TaxID=3391145 RepID=UPI0039ECD4B0